MINRVTFASCYVYSPAGHGEVCERSRLLRALLKEGDARFMVKFALRVHQQTQELSQLNGFFRAADILVPVPSSRPKTSGASWAAADLADALVREGLGAAAWRGLRRIRAVRKSATAAPCARPTVALHYDSFSMEPAIPAPESVVLIDDVITRGRTLLAAAARVHEAYPHAQIRTFALLRTMGLIAGVEQVLDPCTGEIRWEAGDARRIP
jgi:predicted amidophosphoribosyltransferase